MPSTRGKKVGVRTVAKAMQSQYRVQRIDRLQSKYPGARIERDANNKVTAIVARDIASLRGTGLNPGVKGAAAGLAVGGAALAAVEVRAKYKNKARSRSAKAMTKGHAGKAGGSARSAQVSHGKNKGGVNSRGKKTNYKRGDHGRFAGSQ